jgi:hypothetical protein
MTLKSLIVTSVALALLACCGIQASDSDWNFSIGAQYWKPDWSFKVKETGYNPSATTNAFFGPTASLGYKNFRLGVQYFSGDFDSDDDVMELKRKDLDVFLYYSFLKYFTLMVGYKDFEYNYDYVSGYYAGTKYKTTVHGPGAGLSIGTFFGDSGVYIRGSGYYMPSLKGDKNFDNGTASDSDAGSADGDGYTLEAGIGYLWSISDSMRLNLGAGYKIQKMSFDFGTSDAGFQWYDIDDDFKGFKAEISLMF